MRGFANEPFGVKKPCLVNIRNGGTNEKNADVEPIGRSADNTVIGVENDRDKTNTEKYAA